MRNISILFCVCSLFFVAIGDRVCVYAQTKNADQLWVDYQDANHNANAASNNYNTQVDAAEDINDKIDAKNKTLDDATSSTWTNLFVAGGLYFISAPTLFIPALGQVTPTLEWVKAKLAEKALDALKMLADQAASDAHKEAADYAKKKTDAYDAYLAQFTVENPGYGDEGYIGPTPKGTLLDVNHKEYLFSCLGGCGVSFDRIEAADITHKASEVCGTSGVSGCGKTYYTCDPQHQAVSCVNFIGYTCGVSFRPCTNSYCTPSGNLWTYRTYHSAVKTKQKETSSPVRYFCPQCGEVHGG